MGKPLHIFSETSLQSNRQGARPMRLNRGFFRCSETSPNELRIDENRNDENRLPGRMLLCLSHVKAQSASARRATGVRKQHRPMQQEGAITFVLWPGLLESRRPAGKASAETRRSGRHID